MCGKTSTREHNRFDKFQGEPEQGLGHRAAQSSIDHTSHPLDQWYLTGSPEGMPKCFLNVLK